MEEYNYEIERRLYKVYGVNPDGWGNKSLDNYLEALKSWTKDMEATIKI